MKRATALGFAQLLSAASTVDEVDAVIQLRLPELLHARSALLGIVDPDAAELVLRPNIAAAEGTEQVERRVPLESTLPLAEVVRTGEMLVLLDDLQASLPLDGSDGPLSGATNVTTMCFPLASSSGDVVATLAVTWDREIDIDEPTMATVRTVAGLCEDTLHRARSTDHATDRALRLALLAEALADAMTVEQTLQRVAELGGGPVGATATSVGLVDREAGVLRTLHGDGVDDAVRSVFTDPPLDTRLAFIDAARTGEAVLVEDHKDYMDLYPDSASTVASLGDGARAALPVRTSAGEVIGAIIHAWGGPRSFDEELRSTLTTIAEMAGQAIERARLVEQIQREARRHEALASLAELLATARTSAEVAQVVAEHSAPVTSAASANVAIFDAGRSVLRVYHEPGAARSMQEKYAVLGLDEAVPHVDVVRDGGLLFFEELERFGERYPHLLDDVVAAGRQSCAVISLTDSQGERLGAIGFSWTSTTKLDEACSADLHAVADLCSQALERALLSDAEHRLVSTLQASVLAPLPDIPGLDLSARHLPAARHIGMGGDWYQAIRLDDHRSAVIVGDVAGHGITAVGDMAQLRAAIGTLVTLQLPPGDVFRQTTALLRAAGHTVTATAVIAIVDTATDTLRYAAAGHPQPLLRRPDGEVEVLRAGRHPLLGVPVAGIDDVGQVPFPRGSTLVLYTDGLVERRSEPIDACVDRLARQLGDSVADTALAVAEDLIAVNLVGREPDDDIAIIVLTRIG